MSLKFKLESSQTIHLPSTTSTLQTFSFPSSSLSLITCSIPGPLVCTTIIIPTTQTNNAGLPHTLEHLIFTGTSAYKKGFLDTVAVRSLSTGTNAYTTSDHTAYEICTVGEGRGVLEVFLRHVLEPSLTESQFLTEVFEGFTLGKSFGFNQRYIHSLTKVYHVDGQGKSQGVVYCEMASRENTEADLLDLELRRMVYDGQGTYAFECGGLTGDIEKLRNEQVREYHKQFYHPDNVTILICGSGDFKEVIADLERYPDLLQRPTRHSQSPNPDVVTLKLRDPGELPSRTVKFPSDDFSVGSIGYIWPGPKSDDLKTITALEVIHRYLADNPSSLIKKEFVEVVEPLASDIDMEVGEGLDANLVWIFSGVPRIHDGGPDDDDGLEEDSNEDDSIDEDNDDDDSIDEVEVDGSQKDEKDLFAPNFYHSKIMSHLHSITFPDYSLDMKPTLKRHAIKLLESLEDSPHETVAMAIVPEVIRNRLLKTGTLQVGRRLQIFDILKELEGEDEGFWKGLVKKFFIERSANEVMMVPDQQLAKDLAQKQVDDEKRRIKEMGKKGLKKASERVAMALEENKIDLDEADMARMPPVPSAAKAGRIPSRVEIINLCEDGSIFGSCQVVKTETAFVHLGMAINIARVPKELRSYLVLFQELLFQSPLDLITDSGLKVTMPYEEVSTHASKLFISHECGVGFGNSYFSASYLTQVLTLFVTGTPSEWELVVRFVTQVLLFSQFIKKRIISIAKNLLSSIIDVKRDGNGVLGATINRICLSNKFAEECGSNENAISIFEQERFLKGVIEKCKNGREDEVITELNSLRDFVVTSKTAEPTFVRIGVPMRFSVLQTGLTSSSSEITNDFLRIWESEYCKYPQKATKGKKRKAAAVQKMFAFPFPRKPFAMSQMDLKFSKSIIVPVAGLSTSYLSQFVPCDLLQTPKHPDYFPTVLLAEILSVSEGPLYDGVRGKGFAYGVSLSCYLWAGQLSFELYRSSEPEKGLAVFQSILQDLFTKDGFEKYCGKYPIETAKASVAYRWAANCSTSSSLISTTLRSSIQGFKNLDDYRGFVSDLDLVTSKDLERVLNKYYSLFLGDKVTVVVTPPGESEKIAKSMGKEFITYSLDDFAP